MTEISAATVSRESRAAASRGIWTSRLILVALVAWLAIGGYLRHPDRTPVDTALWQNIEGHRATQIAYRLLVELGTPFVGLLLTGMLAPAVIASFRPNFTRRAHLGAIVLLGVLICGLIRTAQLWHLPAPGHLLGPMIAFLVGAWIGQDWNKGTRALAWRIGQIAAILLVAAGVLLGMLWMCIQSVPFPFEVEPVSKSDLRILAETVRGHRDSLDEGRRVELTAGDFDLALGAALARVSPQSKGRVEFVGRAIDAQISLQVPLGGKPKFVNVDLLGAAQIRDGELTLRPDRLSIGSLRIPRFLLRLLAPPLASVFRHDSELRNLLTAIDTLQFDEHQVRVVFKPGECSNTFVPALAHALSGRPKVTIEVREHAQNLLADASSLPLGDDRFAALLRRAFEFAQRRSARGDRLIENRAAMLALAILIGDERVEKVVGPVLDPAQREQAGRELANVTLRGRADWTKHFFVSAAIALLSCEATSNKIGTLKEVLDAEDGGSGFSFGDFAANRAGIRLALAATDDQDSARRTQELLAGQFALDDVFPDVSDLPENLTTAEFQAKFGGVGGAEYLKLLAEIEQRLSQCAALH